jgi:hypothetical protein
MGGKFAAGVNYTSGKFSTGINDTDTCSKFLHWYWHRIIAWNTFNGEIGAYTHSSKLAEEITRLV